MYLAERLLLSLQSVIEHAWLVWDQVGKKHAANRVCSNTSLLLFTDLAKSLPIGPAATVEAGMASGAHKLTTSF